MPRKRLKYPPTRAETGDLERPAWPPWPGSGRPFKHTEWKSGGNENIRMHFAPGTRGGRRVGVPNKFGRELKQQILDAAARCRHSKDGTLEGFLIFCAEQFPQAYLKVVAKLIPYRVDLTHLQHVQTADEIKGALRSRYGIDIDRIFNVPKVPPNVVRLEPRPLDHAHALVIDNNEEANDAHRDDDPPQAAE
jgi:hypothetical protein